MNRNIPTAYAVNRHVFSDPSWAQWAVTAPLLAAHVLGDQAGALLAVAALCIAMTGFFALRAESMRDFRVQVRLGFLAILAIGAIPGLGVVLWLPLIGTTSQVLLGYCLMPRFLRLMPWNRDEAMSVDQMRQIVFGPRGNDGLLARRSAAVAA
jgi:hypothetical protein